MLDIDFLISYIIMSLFFVRQIYILKDVNKFDYSSVVVTVGVLGSLVHFIQHPEATDSILLFKESVLPLVFSLLLYIVMNIMHQTQRFDNSTLQDELSANINQEIISLKKFMSELEKRMIISAQNDKQQQEEIHKKFKDDINALSTIRSNQDTILETFKEMNDWNKAVSHEFTSFKDIQLPELNTLIHKHINTSRVAEQDHYNHLKISLEKSVNDRQDISQELDELKNDIASIKNVSDNISSLIVKNILEELSSITESFESQMKNLKSYSESIDTSLHEEENVLIHIRQQSEMIMKQMVLSSSKMEELSVKALSLSDGYIDMENFLNDVQNIKSDYTNSQAELSYISKQFKIAKNEQTENLEESLKHFSQALSQKVDESLERLHKNYHIADEDISKNVQFLANKTKLKGYTEQS